MTANAIASQPASTKATQVHFRICRPAIPRKIPDCSHGGQCGDAVRKSQQGQQGREFSQALDDKASISSSQTCAFNVIYMLFPFSINTTFHFKAYKSQDQRLPMTSHPFNRCLCLR